MKNQTILQFDDDSAAQLSLAGGKGSSLAKMFQASVPVPTGFIVTTNALNRFLADNALTAKIDEKIARLTLDDEVAIRESATQIKDMIMNSLFSAALRQQIDTSMRELSASLVAVRSSATSEDSEKDSWAGELATYLNTTEHTLIENIKKCWASLFSERAITYRLQKDMQHTAISVAVVVQEMVQSDISGVCFTVHPVSGQKNIMLIEAVWGLGEAIVSGQITPDSYTFEKTHGVVLRVQVAPQQKSLALDTQAEGIAWQPIKDADQQKQKLDYRKIQTLATLCQQVEAFYGAPQDIEWAAKGGKFYIVQSRPITTLA